ncbi:MAG: hypothetical protein CMF90_07500 [Candidatus Marinimicrobia bacterium]|nr:hypothetical protein [Candidatus Neomarinimicrobiota bacterium]|tara:strand:+ start:1325 stop:2014 length:690 start_codon:yes stop_codon:yes gene_type:complete
MIILPKSLVCIGFVFVLSFYMNSTSIKELYQMKKLSVLLIALITVGSAQLRVGLDLSNNVSVGDVDFKNSSPGLRFGYEYTLLTIAGVGVEYVTTGKQVGHFGEEKGDAVKLFPDALSAYGLVRLPVGVPFARGVIRAGMYLPLGSGTVESYALSESFNFIDIYSPGITWGVGVRAKLPVIPIGAELLYQSTSLNLTDDAKQSEILNDEFGFFDGKSISTISLVATYSF